MKRTIIILTLAALVGLSFGLAPVSAQFDTEAYWGPTKYRILIKAMEIIITTITIMTKITIKTTIKIIKTITKIKITKRTLIKMAFPIK